LFETARGKQPKVVNHDDHIFDRLVGVQARTRENLFDTEVIVMELYSIRRSLRRGSTTRATNGGVPKEIIQSWKWLGDINGACP
jgi:hypothetical protein